MLINASLWCYTDQHIESVDTVIPMGKSSKLKETHYMINVKSTYQFQHVYWPLKLYVLNTVCYTSSYVAIKVNRPTSYTVVLYSIL